MFNLSKEDIEKIDHMFNEVQNASKTFMGYPCNQDFDYDRLFPFLEYTVNNIGDPYIPTHYRLNSHTLEREVLDFFAGLMHADKDNFWGYVTNGGTEGNMYGLYLARELYPEGIVYHSQDVHYSITKSFRVLRMKNIMIRSQKNGEIDYDDLKETIHIRREVPPIFLLTIGTTMRAAIDNVGKIRSMMEELAITEYYIHCDAALSGMILPFIDNATPFDFAAGADSISVSGHKFIGCPIPCGVVLAKKKNVDKISKFVEYVGTLDTTLTGSRNGISPIFLWYAIKNIGVDGFKKKVSDCLERADYALAELNKLGCNAWKNDFATTVVFDRPSQDIINKWQLAPQGDISHIIIMPSVTKEMIDEFLDDIKNAKNKG
ncbi:MAG: histidine decarboxylase [Candidatus Ancaeobacter aquaticus]|nr:histidine decarboxylase [Candidatus Ancaeobacter aquaticus]